MKCYDLLATFLAISMLEFASCSDSGEPSIDSSDSTSHNYLWKLDTLGDGNASTLYDVAMINDNLVYAVGDISVRDTMGGFQSPPFNLARWTGRTWELSTVVDSGFGYGANYSIVAFGPDDIWIGGTVPKHWDGTRWRFFGSSAGYPGGFHITAIGGTSSQDLYFGGDDGNLRHFDGATWQVIPTGTTAQIQDIWAGTNSSVGSGVSLMVASEKYTASDRKILRTKQGSMVDTISWPADLVRPIHSVWFSGQSDIYVCGAGVYSYNGVAWKEIADVSVYFTNKIRGISAQDIMVVGDFGIVAHYNGSSWRTYPELMLPAGQIRSVAIKGNTAVAVGDLDATRAIALRAIRR